MTTYYKTLRADGRSPIQGAKWHLPSLQPDGTYKPGRWMPRLKDAEKCVSGYHACKREHLIRWLKECIYELEYDGEPECDNEKCWGTRARLLWPVLTWNERTARLFACDCAEAVLPIYEKHCPNDKRLHEAIAIARRFANGEATNDELAAAYSATRSAAYSAARSAAYSAAYSAQTDLLFDYLEGRKP